MSSDHGGIWSLFWDTYSLISDICIDFPVESKYLFGMNRPYAIYIINSYLFYGIICDKQ